MKTIVIAEAGVNHNGDLEMSKNLIRVAAESGADYVKFQMFNAGKLATPSAVKADYQISNTNSDESQLQMLKELDMLPWNLAQGSREHNEIHILLLASSNQSTPYKTLWQ
jgi:sialic acid synthase SpsE